MDKRMWFVAVMAKHDDGKRVIASCLIVPAINKFQAKVKAGESIRQAQEYKNSDGETRPYTVIEITQLKAGELELHKERFIAAFRSVFGDSEIALRNTYLV